MKKMICVSPYSMAYFFLNGEHHYSVAGGLDDGYKLTAVIPDPHTIDGFILVFTNNEPEPDNMLNPIITSLQGGL
jgi:hypothetical protein